MREAGALTLHGTELACLFVYFCTVYFTENFSKKNNFCRSGQDFNKKKYFLVYKHAGGMIAFKVLLTY
jgi:hypothetical protein